MSKGGGAIQGVVVGENHGGGEGGNPMVERWTLGKVQWMMRSRGHLHEMCHQYMRNITVD